MHKMTLISALDTNPLSNYFRSLTPTYNFGSESVITYDMTHVGNNNLMIYGTKSDNLLWIN